MISSNSRLIVHSLTLNAKKKKPFYKFYFQTRSDPTVINDYMLDTNTSRFENGLHCRELTGHRPIVDQLYKY